MNLFLTPRLSALTAEFDATRAVLTAPNGAAATFTLAYAGIVNVVVTSPLAAPFVGVFGNLGYDTVEIAALEALKAAGFDVSSSAERALAAATKQFGDVQALGGGIYVDTATTKQYRVVAGITGTTITAL